MNLFKENNCHVCKKVFCCKKCREKHEISVHKLLADCNICLFGKTVLRDPPEHLQQHLKTQHLPLHCLFCKRGFESLDELLKGNKCPVGYKNKISEKSPCALVQSGPENSYESPPSYFLKPQQATANCGMFSNLATSTPLQREENKLSEKSDQEVITPVDCSDINKDKRYYNENESLKRKVTFCKTPVIEIYKENVFETERKYEDEIIVTPTSGNSSTAFYSAKYINENSQSCDISKDEVGNSSPIATNKSSPQITEVTETAKKENDTLWISAITSPTDDYKDGNKPVVNVIPATPVIKKRQVNVVVPISVGKIDDLPPNLHSTTNESENNVPVTTQSERDKSETSSRETSENRSVSSLYTDYTSEVFSETSGRLWTSVTRLIKNVTGAVQGNSNVTPNTGSSLKRSFLDYDSLDGPIVKRYKLTEIKCRPPIRELAGEPYSREFRIVRNISNDFTFEVKKTFVDKATQTCEEDIVG